MPPMNTQFNINQLHFQCLGTIKAIADFNGGTITSDAGALLLREIDSANNFIKRFSSCFMDYRNQGYVEHSAKEMIAFVQYSFAWVMKIPTIMMTTP